MTIGQIAETLFGKLCASYGAFGDCTAFQSKGSNYSTYGPMLVEAGFNATGNQVLYNGMTGDQISADIYIGPTYYMRLKHMVKDKINFRARGPNTMLTRQPVQGRANDGGLRIGEMERDGVAAHGMAKFLNESFMVRGDEYYVGICNKTGAVAIYNESQNLFLSPYADGPIEFFTNPDGSQNIKNLSRFGRSFSIIRVPYSLKLLIQELQVMNVQMRIITEDNVDQLLNMSYSDNIHRLTKSNEPIETLLKNMNASMNSELKQKKPIARVVEEEFVPATPPLSPEYPAEQTMVESPAYPSEETMVESTPPVTTTIEDLASKGIETIQNLTSQGLASIQNLVQAPQQQQEQQQMQQQMQIQQPQQMQQQEVPPQEETIPFTPIVQEYGKSEEPSILEIETPESPEEKTESTEEKTESSSNETRKINI
jgi:hypothetical protein